MAASALLRLAIVLQSAVSAAAAEPNADPPAVGYQTCVSLDGSRHHTSNALETAVCEDAQTDSARSAAELLQMQAGRRQAAARGAAHSRGVSAVAWPAPDGTDRAGSLDGGARLVAPPAPGLAGEQAEIDDGVLGQPPEDAAVTAAGPSAGVPPEAEGELRTADPPELSSLQLHAPNQDVEQQLMAAAEDLSALAARLPASMPPEGLDLPLPAPELRQAPPASESLGPPKLVAASVSAEQAALGPAGWKQHAARPMVPAVQPRPSEERMALLGTSLRLGNDSKKASKAEQQTVKKPKSVQAQPSGGKPTANAADASKVDSVRTKLHHLKTDKGALQAEGIQENKASDTEALLISLAVNSGIVFVGAVIFSYLRKTFPAVFMNNALKEPHKVPQASERFFGWIGDSLRLTFDQVYAATGTLDAAMFIEYCHLAMKLVAIIGLPMCISLIPLHYIYGDPEDTSTPAAGPGSLDMLSINNVPDGHWLFIMHAVWTWFVVITAEKLVYDSMDRFMHLRKDWLKSMPKPRSSTVLVDNIPIEFRSDQALKDHFEEIVGEDQILRVYIVRHTEHLLELQADMDSHDHQLHMAEEAWHRSGKDERQRPSHVDQRYTSGEVVDSIDYYRRMKQSTERRVAMERERVRRCAESGDLSVLSSSAFVTFRHRKQADMFLVLHLSPDDSEFRLSQPPDPEDVIYENLMMDKRIVLLKQLLGFSLIGAIFLCFMPLIGGMSQATNLDNLREHIPFVRHIVERNGWIVPIWDGLMRCWALNLVMGFLPLILTVIFYRFFSLKSASSLQVRMTRYYFYWQVLFILLITAMVGNVLDTLKTVTDSPMQVFFLLAESLPLASDFYLNYQVIIWTTHIWELMRFAPFVKFLALRSVCSTERARSLAEPEDQNYYGIGCRTCRLSLQLLIGLTFCSITPMITVLTFVDFAICRVVYGYLLVYAEGRKPDMGGEYWVQQLHHLQEGLIIYIFVMTGVILDRASSGPPGSGQGYVGIAVAVALLYQVVSYNRFYHRFHWRSMSLRDVKNDHKHEKRTPTRRTYDQPELYDPESDHQEEHRHHSSKSSPRNSRKPSEVPLGAGSLLRTACC